MLCRPLELDGRFGNMAGRDLGITERVALFVVGVGVFVWFVGWVLTRAGRHR
jgi:hypothetical protein